MITVFRYLLRSPPLFLIPVPTPTGKTLKILLIWIDHLNWFTAQSNKGLNQKVKAQHRLTEQTTLGKMAMAPSKAVDASGALKHATATSAHLVLKPSIFICK